MSSVTRLAARWRWRARLIEAMALLVLARYLIRAVPMKRWRGTLGKLGEPRAGQFDANYRDVSRAVVRAAGKLPGEYVCLPRAMAVQWMLRRRGLPSAIIIGVTPQQTGAKSHAFHAWVEGGGQIIIGEDPTTEYARGLMLVQP